MSAVLERQPTTYQDYSVDRKAEVLALVKANNGNVLRTANETGISEATIRYWQDNSERFREVREQKQVNLADDLESDARYYLHLARNKAHNAPYNHLMTGAAIAIDKMQLLRNLPTSIILDLNGTDIASVLQGVLGEVIDITPTDSMDHE